jgi:glycosyl transferase family 25
MAGLSSGDEMQPPPLPPVFIINLERSPDRRQHMTEKATALGLPVTFFPAVDGRTLSAEELKRYEPARTRRLYGREMKPGELGCHFSHERLWQKLVEESIPWALILEDDVLLDASLVPALREVPALSRPWELIRFAATRQRRSRVVEPLGEGRRLARLNRGGMGTQGYALSLAGARRLLEYTRDVVYPVDEAIDRYWENGLDLYALMPYPVADDPRYASTIHGAEGRPAKVRRSLPEQAARRWMRFGDMVRRGWHNLTVYRML